ncbi:DUF2142 domain-containing protein [Microbacterium sp.]|uniref:DUF2142 domain-containing protein n=1 Tax=Microbacterium sp. TaxID=51671 RepID=UPI0039E71A95
MSEARVTEGLPPVKSWEKRTLVAITAAFVCVVALWAILTPLYDSPDEAIHVNSAIRLAEGGGWPAPGDAQLLAMVVAAEAERDVVAEERSTFHELQEAHPGYDGLDQMTQHPPLYYAYAAAVLHAVDYLDIRADRALLALRLAGLLFALLLPFFAWSAVRRLTGSPRAAILAAASLLAVPRLANILGSVSNDTLAVAAVSAVVYFGVRMMTGDKSWWSVVGMGSTLAVALLTKSTALPLVGFVGVVLLVWPAGLRLGRRLLRATVAMAVASCGGWWWIRNVLLYGTLQPAGLLYDANPWPEGEGPSVIFFTENLWHRISNSFWGGFGHLDTPLPYFLTDVITVVCLVVVAAFAIRRGPLLWQSVTLAAVPLVCVIALIAMTWPSYVRSQLPSGMQGRYFFVVMVPLIALSTLAWRRLVAPSSHRRAGVVLLLSFAFLAALGLGVAFRGFYPAGLGAWLALSPAGAPATLLVVAATGVTSALALALTVRAMRTAAG